jgi:hypothetical protein
MGEVCRKLGLKNITASRKFPNEYRIIAARFLQRRNETARRRQVRPKSGEYRGQIQGKSGACSHNCFD